MTDEEIKQRDNALFIKVRDAIDQFIELKDGKEVNMEKWDKLYDIYADSIAQDNREALEAEDWDPADFNDIDDDDEDSEPFTDDDENPMLSAFDESTQKHQVFDYTDDDAWPKREKNLEINDLGSAVAMWVVTYYDPENESDTIGELEDEIGSKIL